MVLTLEHNSINNSIVILSSSRLGKEFSTVGKNISERILAFQYLLACDLLKGLARKVDLERRWMHREHMDIPGFGLENLLGNLEEAVSMIKEGIVTMKGVVTKKKYKPVAKKVKPVIVSLPGQYRIIREILKENTLNIYR
jgi:hypothetical protein